jgi:hypothetical protein
MSAGWGRLGKALAGMGNTQEAESDAMLDTARVEHALLRARKERDELNALESLEADMTEVLGDEDLARMFATALRADKNPEQITGARLDTQRFDLTERAATAGSSGDLDVMNVLLSAASGDPMVRNKVEGNTIIDPYQGDANPRITPYGDQYLDNQLAGKIAKSPTVAQQAAADPNKALNDLLVKEVISRFGKLMERDGADIEALTLQRDRELAKLGVGPNIAAGTPPPVRDAIAALNAGADEQAVIGTVEGAQQNIQDRKSIRGKMYVKIDGIWYEE